MNSVYKPKMNTGLLYQKDNSKYEMKVGIALPSLGPQATRDNILQTATQAEREGFDSVWTITRILWPLKPQTPYGLTPDGSLPTEYQTVLDPLDVLAYVTANTSKISLGTSVEDMFFYTPIMLAKRTRTMLHWMFYQKEELFADLVLAGLKTNSNAYFFAHLPMSRTNSFSRFLNLNLFLVFLLLLQCRFFLLFRTLSF